MTSENYFSWRSEIQLAFRKGSEVAHITRIIEQQARELEFDFYALFIRHPVPFTRPKTFFYSNYPQKWIDYYLRKDFMQLDPVLKNCNQPGMIWLWEGDATSAGQRVFDAARTHGIYHGVSCSVMAKNRAVGILSFSSGNPSKMIALTTEFELKLQYISDLSMAALIEINDISMLSTRLELSERELEILKWTAEGKTSAEISLILSISENTVNFHQKNMQKRFNAPNKTQIASYAAAIGLI
ncbi:transcriptional regulator SdiA [Erwinia sorbitola]|uniref:Transcriptional regulator SdiA n=1 Tax=Erwinia sorbitola TaxID=2681984 RepID=A0A6I6F2S4_9GAMM|nr:transcriptional regulator SdiA [Erwinia sorbitola]MTD26546.1 transcriptional regulator SdiA [Erwinia sorbitola]QGU88130.1 transcriptional regulator SdiA [Erwinia sorbitola]